ncbi:hypothetical protein DPMN_068471 [Dreissena polymorpha]|uniref:Uncharacterized protein n=1 Tax=Dreissena polymorpha TaxID=45954 RepID=A0A9D3Z1P0_DREPO|nr:hypothetical protein DPMN_068471 [Dreissena polymorpha]
MAPCGQTRFVPESDLVHADLPTPLGRTRDIQRKRHSARLPAVDCLSGCHSCCRNFQLGKDVLRIILPSPYRTIKSYPLKATKFSAVTEKIVILHPPFGRTRCTLTSRRLSIGLIYVLHIILPGPFRTNKRYHPKATKCTHISSRLPVGLITFGRDFELGSESHKAF